MTEKEAAAAFQEWFDNLPTIDDIFNELEQAEGPGIKAQGPPGADDED